MARRYIYWANGLLTICDTESGRTLYSNRPRVMGECEFGEPRLGDVVEIPLRGEPQADGSFLIHPARIYTVGEEATHA